jgi:hypothetical protein
VDGIRITVNLVQYQFQLPAGTELGNKCITVSDYTHKSSDKKYA